MVAMQATDVTCLTWASAWDGEKDSIDSQYCSFHVAGPTPPSSEFVEVVEAVLANEYAPGQP